MGMKKVAPTTTTTAAAAAAAAGAAAAAAAGGLCRGDNRLHHHKIQTKTPCKKQTIMKPECCDVLDIISTDDDTLGRPAMMSVGGWWPLQTAKDTISTGNRQYSTSMWVLGGVAIMCVPVGTAAH
jgi:hypothetical protein